MQKYDITNLRTLAVIVRGTDAEIRENTLDDYLKSSRIVRENSIEQIIIQTDQRQVRNIFMERFDCQCRFMDELPDTEGSVCMHFVPDAIKKDEWALTCLLW